MKEPRNLLENEIEIKVIDCTLNEVMLGLYTKPQVVYELMNETYGSNNWTSEHTVIPKGDGLVVMLCKISIYDEERQRWISRDDVGEPIGTLYPDKTQSTDAFKRACAQFGVAKELKTMPEPIVCRTFIPAKDKNNNEIKINGFQQTKTLINVTAEENGSLSCHDHFSIVQYLLDEKRNICALCIKDDTTGERIFTRDYRIDAQKKERKAPSAASTVITPLSSPELARFSLLKADTGAFAKKGMTLGQLKPDELLWLFGSTKKLDIKRGCLELALADPSIKEVFLHNNIVPDQLLKELR